MAISRRNLLIGTGGGLAGAAIGASAGIALMTGSGWRRENEVPRVLQVPTLEIPPSQADVVVIGAGIAGISTALFLNERGLKTVLLEKGVVAGEQSGRAFGWVYSNGWDLGKLELTNRSKEIWRGFSARFGEDIGYRQTGNFSIAVSEADIAQHEEWLRSALEIQPQMDSRIIRGAELDALIPGASAKYAGALWQGSDGTAEPAWSVSRIAMGAIREGVVIVAPCAARSIERQAGRIAGVHTEKGYIRCNSVVVAGGAWSSLFAGNAGVRLQQLAIASSLARVGPVDASLPGAGYGPDFAWRQALNGDTHIGVGSNASPITYDSFRYFFDFLPALRASGDLVSIRPGRDFFESLRLKSRWSPDEVTPFEQARMLSGSVDIGAINTSLTNLRRAFPQYERAVLRETWAGMIDATPDSTQFVTDVPDMPGLFVITGFSGNGLTTAPASGEMIAQMIAGEKTTCDPAIYRFNRFTDGSEYVFRH